MGICIQDRRKMILGMEKANTYMLTEVIIMEIGLKGKWRDTANSMTLTTICNMKGSGRMIIIMGKAHCMDLMIAIGLSMLGR
jgi:hypothetical protein